tara:strand:- start:407 stop:727 length:321 start_codon:yes stop_codon:yes gene_type:complete
MSKKNGQKKKKNTTKITELKNLEPGDKFSSPCFKDHKGVLLEVTSGSASVYWYSIPDHWFKKHYDDETDLDEDGRYYEGLDVYFFKKKTYIGPNTGVIKIGEVNAK